MSRWIITEENEFEEETYKEIKISRKECEHKVNGKCFNNKIMNKLGKRCYEKCGEYKEDA